LVAVVYGEYGLALGAALFFWLAALSYTKSRLAGWSKWKRCVGSVLMAGAIAVVMCAIPFVKARIIHGVNTGVQTKGADGFSVDFRFAMLNMSRRLDVSPFWVLYSSSYGQTISPVAIAAVLSITSDYNYPVAIKTYSMRIETQCGWIRLTPIDARMVQLLFALKEPKSHSNELEDASLLDLSDSYSAMWSKPILAHEPEFGWMLFATPQSVILILEIKSGSSVY
jgi:hypothetical protein